MKNSENFRKRAAGYAGFMLYYVTCIELLHFLLSPERQLVGPKSKWPTVRVLVCLLCLVLWFINCF